MSLRTPLKRLTKKNQNLSQSLNQILLAPNHHPQVKMRAYQRRKTMKVAKNQSKRAKVVELHELQNPK